MTDTALCVFRALDGRELEMKLPRNTTGQGIRRKLNLEEFAGDTVFRLVLAGSQPRELEMSETLSQAGVTDRAELLVLESAGEVVVDADDDAAEEQITRDAILKATASLPQPQGQASASGSSATMVEPAEADVILAVVSALLQISKTIQQALGKMPADKSEEGGQEEEEDEAFDPEKQVDPNSLSQLQNMGFSKMRCINALLSTQMNVQAALEWLFAHENDESASRPPSPPPKSVKTRFGTRFVPDPTAYRRLKEMGFPQDLLVPALQLAQNRFEVACDLLVQGRDVKKMQQEREESAQDTSAIVKAVLRDSLVRESLADLRMTKVLELVLQDIDKASVFLQDRHLGPPLLKIISIVKNPHQTDNSPAHFLAMDEAADMMDEAGFVYEGGDDGDDMLDDEDADLEVDAQNVMDGLEFLVEAADADGDESE